jgi:hypothetical protein
MGTIKINGQEYPHDGDDNVDIGDVTGGTFAIGNNNSVRSYNYYPARTKQSTAPSGLQLKPGADYVEVFFDGHFVKFVGKETMVSPSSRTHFSIGGVPLVYREAESKLYLEENNVELTSATAGVFRSKGIEVHFVC